MNAGQESRSESIARECEEVARACTTLEATLSLPVSNSLAPLADLLPQPAAESRPARSRPYPDDLTQREVDVLRLIAHGKSNRDIADAIFITVNTTANHVKSILSKIGAANRTQAAAYAIENGLQDV